MGEPPIHIARWGTAGPPVILIHGGTQGTPRGGEESFANQRALADRGWRLILPDRPGHGRSPDPGRPDDAEADAAWVADLLAEGAHLVGHSYGGCVALAAAAKQPALVRSLTLIEPAMHGIAASDPRVRRWMLRMGLAMAFSMSAASRAKRVMKLVGIPPEVTAPASREDLARLGRSLRRGKLPSKATLERELGEIRRAAIPLLVVTGGWSPAFEASADVVADTGGGRRAVVASPHHFPQSVSDEFNETLAGFMGESDSKRR
jgi:pimeloyl-ACP methyl ester carboxylesterase